MLAATRPEAAAIILGAAKARASAPEGIVQLVGSALTAALGEQPVRDLRARGADMDWDQALACTLTQTSQALSELRSETQQ